MPTTEQLLADLSATAPDFHRLDDDSYFDWSQTGEGGGVLMEVGDGVDAVQLEMSRDDVVGLQQRLTAWLLATR